MVFTYLLLSNLNISLCAEKQIHNLFHITTFDFTLIYNLQVDQNKKYQFLVFTLGRHKQPKTLKDLQWFKHLQRLSKIDVIRFTKTKFWYFII